MKQQDDSSILHFLLTVFLAVVMFFVPTSIPPDPVDASDEVIVLVYDQPAKPDTITRAVSMDGQVRGQCVEFIQRLLGSYYTHPDFRGVAGDIVPNSDKPKVGSAVLTRDSVLGHAALIIEVGTSTITVVESNYSIPLTVEVGRIININSNKIVGYFDF